jgi:hypothetical protein
MKTNRSCKYRYFNTRKDGVDHVNRVEVEIMAAYPYHGRGRYFRDTNCVLSREDFCSSCQSATPPSLRHGAGLFCACTGLVFRVRYMLC